MIVLYLSLLFDDVLVCLPFCWCPCMAINVSVQYDGGFLPDIVLLTQCYYHRETRLNATRGQSAHLKIPLETFSPSGGVSSGILPSRGILKNIILCRHKTFNPPEGLIPCMPCRGKTYKIPLAFFSISTPAGFNLVENSGGKT